MSFSLRPLSVPSSVLPKLGIIYIILHLLFGPQPYNFSTVVCLIHFFKSVFKNLTSLHCLILFNKISKISVLLS